MKLIWIGLALWNAFAFLLYGMDKRRAIKGDWRISEKTLLLVSLAAGGMGAYLGGRIFHHKTLKWYFRVTWYLGILVDAAIIYLLWRI